MSGELIATYILTHFSPLILNYIYIKFYYNIKYIIIKWQL